MRICLSDKYYKVDIETRLNILQNIHFEFVIKYCIRFTLKRLKQNIIYCMKHYCEVTLTPEQD
jgi:hypothetical protein